MSNKIPCAGCGKIYPLWIAADAKPVDCSECGARVEQRQVQPIAPNPTPPIPQKSAKKVNFVLIFFNTAIIGTALLLIISIIGVGIYMAIAGTGGEPPHSDKLYITDVSDEKSVEQAVGLVTTAMVYKFSNTTNYYQFAWEPIPRAEIEEKYSEKQIEYFLKKRDVIRNKLLLPDFGGGSCFLITANGFAITNHHVVAGYLRASADRLVYKDLEDRYDDDVSIIPKLFVYLDDIHHSAKVVYDSTEYDFAILKIDSVSDSPYFRLASSPDIPRLTKVTVLGFPASAEKAFDLEELLQEEKNLESLDPRNWYKDSDLDYVATRGEISKVSERGNKGLLVQHTAIIDGGNSGGPLVTNEGVVLGINSWQSSYVSEGGRIEGVGNNFSLSIHTILDEIVEQNSHINVLWVDSLPKPDN